MIIQPSHRLISLAPMMDYTDRHARYFIRQIAPSILLYTEMITAHALHHGDVEYLLGFDQAEHPLALQLGGSDPGLLTAAAKLGESFGYDEINLNIGCPSPRVKRGRFGACLMLEAALVAECIAAMRAAVSVPVTVKCRIGVDHQDSEEDLHAFITTVSATGCDTFVVHARKAWLSGLSPKQNRTIPPLDYDRVYRLKTAFPRLTIIINGGIKSLAEVITHKEKVDGIMIGRQAFIEPYLLATLEKHFMPDSPIKSRVEIIQSLKPYIAASLANKVRLHSITRHLLGLFHGQPGAASWRRYISQHACNPEAGLEVIESALKLVT